MTTMKLEPETPAVLSVPEAIAAQTAARAEVVRLRELASGAVGCWRTRVEHDVYPDHRGLRAERDVEVKYWDVTPVDRSERRRAERDLPAAEARLLDAEIAVEHAKQRAAVALRVTRDRLRVEGEPPLRVELARLVKEQRKLQRQWQALQAKAEALDQQLGVQSYGEVGWGFIMAAGSQCDHFLRAMTERFDLDV